MAKLGPFHRSGTHRLIPAKYSNGSVLETLSLPAEVIANLSELDAATNERKLVERHGGPVIGPTELLYGVPEAHIVNAAFCHPGPSGARFSDSRRGAWYASVELETSIAEVAYHRRLFLKDTRAEGEFTFEYAEFLADFYGEFHFLGPAESHDCLQPRPIPQCYGPSQALALTLLSEGSNGIVYKSVRHRVGTCIACFRPALVYHPRRGAAYRITVKTSSREVDAKRFKPKF